MATIIEPRTKAVYLATRHKARVNTLVKDKQKEKYLQPLKKILPWWGIAVVGGDGEGGFEGVFVE